MEDDEPFLDGNGINDGDDDFSRFAKTWRSRHTIIEEGGEEGGEGEDQEDNVQGEKSEGFFTETGAFHIPPYEEYASSSSEGIASDGEFTDGSDECTDDDDEPLVGEAAQSELEKVLQEGLRDVTKEIEQLVFA